MITGDQTVKDSGYSPRTVRSVVHAVALLKELGASATSLTLSVLARKIGLSKPATYNLLNTLVAEDLVRKDENAKYRLSWGVYELGSAVDRRQALKRASRFSLDRLAQNTRGASLLSILEKGSVLYLDRGQQDSSFTMVANIGRRSPWHTNASGKVLMAFSEAAFINQYLTAPLKARTTTTVTDIDQLAGELRKIRLDGYGSCWGEQEPELSSIAVPILDGKGALVASLAVAIPTQRIRKMSRSGLVEQVRLEACVIADSLRSEVLAS